MKHDIVLHASTNVSSSSAMLEQVRRSTNDSSRHVTTRTTRRACRVATWRNKWNLELSTVYAKLLCMMLWII